MATFTESQITDLAVILSTSSDELNAHLDLHGSLITESDKTVILAQVTRYTAGTVSGGVWFEATESNEGFNMGIPFNAGTRDPREIISALLRWQGVSLWGWTRLVRA